MPIKFRWPQDINTIRFGSTLAWSGQELPDNYKRLIGFTFNNNGYFEILDFKMRGSDTLRFSFKCTGTTSCNVLGAYDGTSVSTNYSLYVGQTNSPKYLRYNGNTYDSTVVQNKTYNVVITPTGSQGMQNNSTWSTKTFESSGNLCIGTTSPTATSSKMIGNIIGEIIVDGRLKLIPCEKDGNAIGYYDTYSKTFYSQTGSGVTSMGYA